MKNNLLLKALALVAGVTSWTTVANPLSAGILFARMGNDLTVEVTSPITLTANTANSGGGWGLLIEDLYDSPVPGGLTPDTPGSSLFLDVNGANFGNSNRMGHFAFSFGAVGNRDFLVLWDFIGTVPNNSSITISAGSATAVGWFIERHSAFPTTDGLRNVSLVSNRFGRLTNQLPVNVSVRTLPNATVPEPASLAVFGLIGGVGILRHRSRRCLKA